MPERREMSEAMRQAYLHLGSTIIWEAPAEALDEIIKALVDILKDCQERAVVPQDGPKGQNVRNEP